MWVAVVMQVGVIYFSLRMGNYLFAAHAVVQQCLYAMIAWRGEPARGTGMVKVMWGLFALSGVLIGAVLLTQPG